MSAIRTLTRAGAVLAAAALLVPTGAAPATARGSRSDMITMTVDSVSPAVPVPTEKRTPLTVTLTVTNTTAERLTDISIVGERGDPIGNQSQLDAMLANPSPPSSPGLEIPSNPRVTIDELGADSSTTVSFVTSTSIQNDGKGICICTNPDLPALIYPLFFSAHELVDGVDNRLGVVATYLPAFYDKPAPIRVSWIWPLLEPPHRLTSDTEFVDDDLATSVSTGRLSRALSVVEGVRSTVPMTLLIDPELLDELEVMADGQYTVVTSGTKSVPGTGQAAAADWLRRLRSVLQDDPNIDVKLTPYADPDIQALVERNMTWSSDLPADMVPRVTDALAGRPIDASLAWPSGPVGPQTLRTLSSEGVRTIVLNSATVATGTPEGGIPPGLTRFNVGNPNVVAALTSPAVEKYVHRAIGASGAGAAALPPLLAELAVRAAQEPEQEHALLIAAPHYVDPDVSAAVATIEETSRSLFAEPISLGEAVGSSLVGTNYSRLLRVPASAAKYQSVTLDGAAAASAALPTITALLDQHDDARARAFVASLPAAIQRAESSAWRGAGFESAANRFVARLQGTVTGITDGVRIARPTSGTYTLASDNSPLPITVENTLPYQVNVRIKLGTELPGFSWTDIGAKHVEANQTHTFKIPTTVERAGTIRIHAQLFAGDDTTPLGESVTMRVRSTAFGVVGVIITIVAGVALAIALLWRVVRRLRSRSVPQPPPATEPAPLEPEPVP